MGERNYWLQLFTLSTWNRFIQAGAKVTGFRESMMRGTHTIVPGDYLIAYLTGVSRFVALLEATSKPFVDETPIWREAVLPARVKVRLVVCLTPETAIFVHDLSHKLSMFSNFHLGLLRPEPFWLDTAKVYSGRRGADVVMTSVTSGQPAIPRSTARPAGLCRPAVRTGRAARQSRRMMGAKI